MSVKVQCPSCKKTTSVPEKYLGRKAECPNCKVKFTLEAMTDDEAAVAAEASAKTDPTRSASSESGRSSPKHADAEKPVASTSPKHPADEEHEEAPRPAPFTVPHSSESHENMVDMTAMVDIVFFLLVFFIMTSILAMTSSIAMPVPKQETNQASGAKSSKTVTDIQEQGESLTVKVDGENKISIEGIEIPSEQDLLIRLRAEKAKYKKMLVMGHANATHGTIVMVMDAGNDVGFESLMLSVVDEEK